LKRIIDCQGTLDTPVFCVLIPITPDVPVHLAKRLLQKADPDAEISNEEEDNLQRVVHIRSPLLDKHFAVVNAKSGDVFACIDLINLADWVVMLVPSGRTELDSKTESFLTALYAQGLGNVSYAVMSSSFNEKEIKHNLLSRFPVPESVIYPLNTPDHALNLLRHIGVLKKSRIQENGAHSSSRFRAKMLVDSLTLMSVPGLYADSENSNSMQTYLKVQGLLRGSPLYFDDPIEQVADEQRRPFVYLTGWGDFPLASASWINKDTTAQQWAIGPLGQTVVKLRDNVLRSSSVTNGSVCESSEESDSVVLVPPAAEGISRDDSVQEDMDTNSETDEVSLDEDLSSAEMSAFCARSMASSRASFSSSQLTKFREARAEELYPDEIETPVNQPARERFAKYRNLPNFQNSIWPFEKDALPNQYDNIACFRNYNRNRRSIIRYLSERARDVECNLCVRPKCIPPDVYADLALGPMSRDIAKQIVQRHAPSSTASNSTTPPPLVVWSLLPHENRISVCHFTMKRVLPALRAKSDLVLIATAANNAAGKAKSFVIDQPSLCLGEEASTKSQKEQDVILNALNERKRQKVSIRRSVYHPGEPLIPPEAEPIKSKELMVFQAGIRRFITAPIYSTQTTNAHEKAKYETFFPAIHSGVVASVYAPVMYSPVNTLQFRIRVDEDEYGDLSAPYIGELVATGGLHSVDPTRLIVKRIFLSGHPYKIHQRRVVVRFMFFNPLDVEYFKTVKLQTRSGAVGHITDSVGTHGAMKCIFDRPLKASDVILMPLYKRVFPKWLYQPTMVRVLKAPQIMDPTYQWQKAPDVIQLKKKSSSSSTQDEDTVGMEGMNLFD
ncbi:pre-rRNA-processing protein TSR1, partial [Clonorchis sinensis]